MTVVRKRGNIPFLEALRWNILTPYSDDEDEAAELMRELEKIKRERLEQKEKEVGFNRL
jgi:hypothetical protein